MGGAGPSAALRVLSADLTEIGAGELVELARSEEPDAVILRGGPRRLRWRTRSADLANRCGLLYAGGGEPALGNLVLVGLRVSVLDTWYVQFPLVPGRLMYGAALVRGRVGGAGFVLAGTRLSPHGDERTGHATALTRVLASAEDPVVLTADPGDAPGSPPWQILADGRVEAGALTSDADAAAVPWPVFLDAPIEVTGVRRPAGAGAAVVLDLRLPVP